MDLPSSQYAKLAQPLDLNADSRSLDRFFLADDALLSVDDQSAFTILSSGINATRSHKS